MVTTLANTGPIQTIVVESRGPQELAKTGPIQTLAQTVPPRAKAIIRAGVER
jgi:hypothetical protein